MSLLLILGLPFGYQENLNFELFWEIPKNPGILVKGKQVLHKITKMFLEFKQVLRMYRNSPGTKYYSQNVYGLPQVEIFLMTYQLKTKLN